MRDGFWGSGVRNHLGAGFPFFHPSPLTPPLSRSCSAGCPSADDERYPPIPECAGRRAAMPKVMVLAGTTDGLFVFESDAKRAKWKRRGPYLKGLSVNHFAWDRKTKTAYAATFSDGLFASKNQGRSWTPISDGLPIRKVWSVAVNPKDPDELWAGTHFSYLFHRTDRGHTWPLHPGYLTTPRN